MKATIAVVDRDPEVIQCPEFTTKNHRNRIRTLYNNSRSVSFGAGPADRLGSYLNHLQSFIKNFCRGSLHYLPECNPGAYQIAAS